MSNDDGVLLGPLLDDDAPYPAIGQAELLILKAYTGIPNTIL